MSKIFPHRNRKPRPASQRAPVVIEDPIAHRQRVEAERRERDRIEAERQRRRAAARESKACREALTAKAAAAFPWEHLNIEIRIFDRITRTRADAIMAQRVTGRASYFAVQHVFGPESYEILPRLAPNKMDRETWEIIETLSPITTNREHISRIVDFLAHCFGNEPELRQTIEEAAEHNRGWIAERIETAHERRSIGDDWFLTGTQRVDRLIWRRMGPSPPDIGEAAGVASVAILRKMETRDAAFGDLDPRKRRLDLSLSPSKAGARA
jgi:hypothetical protein